MEQTGRALGATRESGSARRAVAGARMRSPRYWLRGGSGEVGGCDSSPEAPGRGARGGGAQGASSVGLWRGEWGMHQGGGVLADRLRWCGYSRAHETQTAREVWLARGGQAALSSVMVWRRRRRSVQRFGSAEVWLSESDVRSNTIHTATSNPVPRAVGASKIGHPNRHGCDRNAKELPKPTRSVSCALRFRSSTSGVAAGWCGRAVVSAVSSSNLPWYVDRVRPKNLNYLLLPPTGGLRILHTRSTNTRYTSTDMTYVCTGEPGAGPDPERGRPAPRPPRTADLAVPQRCTEYRRAVAPIRIHLSNCPIHL